MNDPWTNSAPTLSPPTLSNTVEYWLLVFLIHLQSPAAMIDSKPCPTECILCREQDGTWDPRLLQLVKLLIKCLFCLGSLLSLTDFRCYHVVFSFLQYTTQHLWVLCTSNKRWWIHKIVSFLGLPFKQHPWKVILFIKLTSIHFWKLGQQPIMQSSIWLLYKDCLMTSLFLPKHFFCCYMKILAL